MGYSVAVFCTVGFDPTGFGSNPSVPTIMNDLSLEEINKHLAHLEAMPPFLDKTYTLEEAKAFLGEKYISENGLTVDKDIIIRAESIASAQYPADRNCMISVYRILKCEKEAEIKSEIALERLNLYGVWMPPKGEVE